jgi:hypothetical protein
MKDENFHIPFIHSMIIVGATTLLLMFSSKFFVEKYLYVPSKTQDFTSSQNISTTIPQ